ncbi:hypothetical protein D3C83_103410 [compost metagenome]
MRNSGATAPPPTKRNRSLVATSKLAGAPSAKKTTTAGKISMARLGASRRGETPVASCRRLAQRLKKIVATIDASSTPAAM